MMQKTISKSVVGMAMIQVQKCFYALFENGDAIEFFGEDCNECGYIAMAKRNKFSVYYYDEETAREMANEDDADDLLIYSGLKKFFQERDEV